MKKSVHSMIDNFMPSLALFAGGAWVGPELAHNIAEVGRAVFTFFGA